MQRPWLQHSLNSVSLIKCLCAKAGLLMVYWIGALTFLFLGLMGQRGVLLALLAFACLPIGNAFAVFFYANGLYVYDFYFVAAFLVLLKRSLEGQLVFCHSFALSALVLVVLYAVLSLYAGYPDKYYLRDYRLVLYVLYLYFFITTAADQSFISTRSALLIVVAAGASSIAYGTLSSFGLIGFDDAFYEKNAFRYFAVSSYICASYFAFSAFVDERQKKSFLYPIAVVIAFFALVLTGFRVLTLISMIVFVGSRLASRRGFVFLLLSILVLVVGIPLVSESNELVVRLLSLDYKSVSRDIYIRYSPFFSLVSSYTDLELFFGRGFGTVFEIPWFYYRENLDPLNNSIDSTYLTLFSKLGVFSLLYIGFITAAFSKLVSPSDLYRHFWVWFFFLSIYLVYSVPYQITGVGLAIGIFLLRRGQFE